MNSTKPLFDSPVAEARKPSRYARRYSHMNDTELAKPIYIVAKPKIKHREVLSEYQIPLPPLKPCTQNTTTTHLAPDFPKPIQPRNCNFTSLGSRRADNDKRCRLLKRLKENFVQVPKIPKRKLIGPDATLIAMKSYRRVSVSNPRNLLQSRFKDTIERKSVNQIQINHWWRNALRETKKNCCLTTLNTFRTDLTIC